MQASIRIKALRENAGLSQAQLARKMGISQSTVGMWESGKSMPKNAALEKLASIFDATTDYILGRTNIKKELAAPGAPVRIPVLGSIPAGIPIEAIEDIIDWEEIPADWTRGNKQYFALQVKGVSMYPEYRDGDVIVLKRQETAENGQDCAVSINGDEATFKRFRRTESGIMLQAINPDFEPLLYTEQQVAELPVRILGVVVELRRKIGG